MRHLALTIIGFLTLAAAAAEPASIIIQTDKPGPAISPLLNGIFFEDINFGADGGLYPERVKNGAFEFDDAMMGWKKIAPERGKAFFTICTDKPVHPNTARYLSLYGSAAGVGIENEGFCGMGFTAAASYTFSVYARSNDLKSLNVELLSAQGEPIGQATLSGFTSDWKKHSVQIKPAATEPKGRLRVTTGSAGTIDMDLISLFPDRTFADRPNGLRPDLAQLLKDLKPGFMRFPGGCIVEGHTLANRYQWKSTVGPLPQRKLLMNRWNDEFKNRAAPDYFQSFGLGFFEYFQLCEDIGAEPLPILACGMSCQFNSGELVPLNQLDPHVQDALDLVEFANGPATSTWGKVRADMGHPAPFNLKLLGIGNEQWGQQYVDRYEIFAKAIKTRYPQIKLISSAGPSPDGKDFTFAWKRLRELNADIVDEHYYRDPAFFLKNATRYDSYDRSGPKVFAGEYACHVQNKSNNWLAAVSEAALMTGLERNGDLVVMASYAPLFAHIERWQWKPNLIWMDNLRSFGTPSYYVQQLFSLHRAARVLPATLGGDSNGLFVVAGRSADDKQVIIKVVNTRSEAANVSIKLAGATDVQKSADMITLSGDPKDENTLDEPLKINPKAARLSDAAANFTHGFPANSLTVLRLDAH